MALREQWTLVDDRDRVLGPAAPRRCLRLGLRHRAITVLLSNAAGDLYLQLRSGRVRWYPNTWTASATGHVRFPETYRQAAARELYEELGVRCRLHRLGKQRTPPWPFGKIVECEFITVFHGSWERPIHSSSDEVAGGEFVSLKQLGQEIATKRRACTPDLLLALDLLRSGGDLHPVDVP